MSEVEDEITALVVEKVLLKALKEAVEEKAIESIDVVSSALQRFVSVYKV